MKRLLLIPLVMVSFSILGPSHDTTAQVDWIDYPDEICFPEIPGIEHCIEPYVGIMYLQSPFSHDMGARISQREAILLWGMPLTELRFERNADGHCVLTQWFERAVFEFHHPGNHLPGLLTLRRLGAELRGDTSYTPALCTAEDHFNER